LSGDDTGAALRAGPTRKKRLKYDRRIRDKTIIPPRRAGWPERGVALFGSAGWPAVRPKNKISLKIGFFI